MSGGLDLGVLANEGYGWLLDSSFLGRLGEQDAAAVLARSAWRTLAPGDVLIEAGVEATTVFLLSSGEAQVQVDGRAGWVEIARVGPGHLVGEAAHLKRTRTGARVTAATPVRALTWPAADFAALLVQVPPLTAYVRGLVELRARTERTRDLLRGDPVLRSLGRAEQDRLLQSGSLMHVDAGGTVIAAGERTRDVFLLLEGQVAIFAPPDAQGRGARLGEKGPGWLFGHAAILLGAPRTADGHPIPQRDYVLSRFSEDEQKDIAPAMDSACDALECWLSDGIDLAMTRFNTRSQREAQRANDEDEQDSNTPPGD